MPETWGRIPSFQAVRVPAGAVSVTVHARMLECTGELWIDDLAVIDCPAELSREVVPGD